MIYTPSGMTVSIHCFAWWSTPEAILFIQSFHLLLDPGYRVSPASRTKQSFSLYMVPVTLFFNGIRSDFILYWYKGNICSKNQPVLVAGLVEAPHNLPNLYMAHPTPIWSWSEPKRSYLTDEIQSPYPLAFQIWNYEPLGCGSSFILFISLNIDNFYF